MNIDCFLKYLIPDWKPWLLKKENLCCEMWTFASCRVTVTTG